MAQINAMGAKRIVGINEVPPDYAFIQEVMDTPESPMARGVIPNSRISPTTTQR